GEEVLLWVGGVPKLSGMGAQLMLFGGPVEGPLGEEGFHFYTRQFMLFDLQKSSPARNAASAGMRLDRWNDRFFEPCAKLIYLCYANHVDGDSNDQHRRLRGAMKFLKTIILLPGCCRFEAGA